MALVEFQENENDTQREFHVRSPRINFFGAPETPTMIKLLLKSKIARTEKQALGILIGLIVVALIAAAVIYKLFIATGGQSSRIIDASGRIIDLKQYILDSAQQSR